MLTIVGLSHFGTPEDVKAAAYQRLVDHAAAGSLRVDYEQFGLDGVTEAWRRQVASPNRKLVLTL
jgi:hypothetical protein